MPARHPLGVYIRNTPDWFLRRAASVGGFYAPVAVTGTAFDLYNNANDGSYLHVYAMWVGGDGTGPYPVHAWLGHGANFLQNAGAVVAGVENIPGQLYVDTVPMIDVFHDDTPISSEYVWNEEGAVPFIGIPPGPIKVLPPGWSLRMSSVAKNVVSGDVMSANYYFVNLPDAG